MGCFPLSSRPLRGWPGCNAKFKKRDVYSAVIPSKVGEADVCNMLSVDRQIGEAQGVKAEEIGRDL